MKKNNAVFRTLLLFWCVSFAWFCQQNDGRTDVFFTKWEELCNRIEEERAGANITEIGLILSRDPWLSDEIYGVLTTGIRLQGCFQIRENKVFILDSRASKPILLFDYSMEPGEIFQDTVALLLSKSSPVVRAYQHYSLKLIGKRVDTCINDVIYMFDWTPHAAWLSSLEPRHRSDSSEEQFRNFLLEEHNRGRCRDVYFVGAKSGVLGWASGKMIFQPENSPYRLLPYGKQYFSPDDQLDSYFHSNVFLPDSAIRYPCTKELPR